MSARALLNRTYFSAFLLLTHRFVQEAPIVLALPDRTNWCVLPCVLQLVFEVASCSPLGSRGTAIRDPSGFQGHLQILQNVVKKTGGAGALPVP